MALGADVDVIPTLWMLKENKALVLQSGWMLPEAGQALKIPCYMLRMDLIDEEPWDILSRPRCARFRAC